MFFSIDTGQSSRAYNQVALLKVHCSKSFVGGACLRVHSYCSTGDGVYSPCSVSMLPKASHLQLNGY